MKLTRQQFLKALPASALLLAGCAAKQTAPANTEALVFDHAYPLDYPGSSPPTATKAVLPC